MGRYIPCSDTCQCSPCRNDRAKTAVFKENLLIAAIIVGLLIGVMSIISWAMPPNGETNQVSVR